MMMSPLCTKAGAYVLVMAASTPFFFQLYATAVRLLNDAVNVGRVFAQITVSDAEIVTAGARYGLTVTVTGLETEDEQPNISVEVTVYVPLALTVMLFVVAPLLHKLPDG
jgi:hypothetical protein